VVGIWDSSCSETALGEGLDEEVLPSAGQRSWGSSPVFAWSFAPHPPALATDRGGRFIVACCEETPFLLPKGFPHRVGHGSASQGCLASDDGLPGSARSAVDVFRFLMGGTRLVQVPASKPPSNPKSKSFPQGGPLLTEDERSSLMITSPCLVLVITSMGMIMIMLMIQPETCCPILLLRPRYPFHGLILQFCQTGRIGELDAKLATRRDLQEKRRDLQQRPRSRPLGPSRPLCPISRLRDQPGRNLWIDPGSIQSDRHSMAIRELSYKFFPTGWHRHSHDFSHAPGLHTPPRQAASCKVRADGGPPAQCTIRSGTDRF
jgi:hypothetical protein